MRPTLRIREYFAILLVAALPASAAVNVAFAPGPYADIGPPGPDADQVKAELARHLQSLGARYLAPDELLDIEVLDVDLAGELEYGRIAGREIRVARGNADFPRITLRYALQSGARATRGEESIADTSYLWFPSRAYSSGSLAHEKRMLDAWFRQRFAR